MIKIYAKLIILGRKILEEVPPSIRLAVEMEVERMKANT